MVQGPEGGGELRDARSRALLEAELQASRGEIWRLGDRLSRLSDQLALRERAMDYCGEGITIADNTLPDRPLVYVNAGFERLTGYTAAEVLGRNCRFLQGPDTAPESLAGLRAALDAGREYTTELLNYRRDGTAFWNRLALTPLLDTKGRVTHYVGVQSDITQRVRSEKALEAANAKMLRNLELAARVQQGFLPADFKARPPLRAAWRFRPCERLAGDLLGIAYLDASRVAVHMLDVTGHGTAAALLAVSANQALGALAGNPPAEVADALNRQFRWDVVTAQFFTLVYGVLDLDSLAFEYVTAGHPPPVIHAGAGEQLPVRGEGLPIGVGDAPYRTVRARLQAGARMLLFSDGVSEMRDEAGEYFGLERIRGALAQTAPLPLEESLDVLLARLEEWHGRRDFEDDVSLLAVEISSR